MVCMKDKDIVYHRHHIIPKHMGGGDSEGNIERITVPEHADRHEALWLEHGRIQDYWAMCLLRSDNWSADKVRVRQSQGGYVQGRRNAESGHMARIQKMVDHSAAGKKGSATCKERGVNAFFDPELKKDIAKLGGAAQGKANVESGHIARLAEANTKVFIYNGKEYRGRDAVAAAAGCHPHTVLAWVKKGKIQRREDEG